MATPISDHFTLEELTATQHRELPNTPGPQETANLYLLAAEQLESIRVLWGCPIHVLSGYRSPAVNQAVGGARNSQHTQGLAADVVPLGSLTLAEAFKKLLASGIEFDQAIYECPQEHGGWIHVSRPAHGCKARRQALMYQRTNGVLAYAPWDAEKARVA